MKWIKFLIESIKAPRTVGAIAPSQNKLAKEMMADIDFDSATCIVEYGPGTGVFTDELINKKGKHTKLIIIENNKVFYDLLGVKYSNCDNIIIINDSAENIGEHLKKHSIERVDYIVSGLPFTSLPKHISNKILAATREILKEGGMFITFQYTLLKKDYIAGYFKSVNYCRVLLNFPPAYVLRCKNA
ncbi:class I SAM-dependent methyltransferase [Neobacillus massiliamazoniensis]|uniref:Ribosomal RNA adenine dimethylase domain protein n=1 Tax=Neobacillus massiliamazoniensis TaxID=1499688 RepID=A0A0U1NYW9_9BACI|nr:rRNA adenine N-6-methyltransferase family protein [Neobacillus massiliamazoniensis]CRK83206.1 ribosomal RNA adenine dimethylase domain protein [Neobacillus massiliamazoniensis]